MASGSRIDNVRSVAIGTFTIGEQPGVCRPMDISRQSPANLPWVKAQVNDEVN